MKILYFYVSDGNPHSGVSKKVTSVVNTLSKLGVDVDLIVTCEIKKERYLPTYFSFLKPLIIIQRNFEIRRDLCRCINSLGKQDIIYFRSPILPLSIYPIKFLKRFRSCKIVSEHQSIETSGSLGGKRYLSFLTEIIFGRIIRQQLSGIVSVTDQIRRYQIQRVKTSNIPNITIGNGLDVASISVRRPPLFANDAIHFLCVAMVQSIHGLDRLLQGLAACSEAPKVTLHIAGDGAELPHLQKLAGDLGISDRVVFHGFTTGKALDALFDQCHIAVGSLGIHRKGLTQTSELKGREYCARGIPYIIACPDPDFPPDFPYILHLPADESPIDIEQVLTFAREVCADPDHPAKMRHYAEEHLDWSVKMKKLKDFLEALVGEGGTPEPGTDPLTTEGPEVPGGTGVAGAGPGDTSSGSAEGRGS